MRTFAGISSRKREEMGAREAGEGLLARDSMKGAIKGRWW